MKRCVWATINYDSARIEMSPSSTKAFILWHKWTVEKQTFLTCAPSTLTPSAEQTRPGQVSFSMCFSVLTYTAVSCT